MRPLSASETPETRLAGATTLAVWIGGGGALLLAGGTWFASRLMMNLGPVVIVALAVAALGAGLVLAAAVLSMIVPSHIEDDARTLADALEAASRGDLSRDPERARDGSPLGIVGTALHQALVRFRSTLGTARGAAREAAQRAEELGTQCSAAHVAAQRSAEQGAHVAEQASVAAERAREVHSDLARLSSGIGRLEGQLRYTDDVSTRAATYAATAGGNLDDAASGLDELTTRFTAASAELAGLGRSVEDVQEFVALVRKMARQSKLLSLNAAMEAARAGEQGSGFGVVAAEVRRLARSSSEAADRTENLLQALLTRAGVAQESARDSLVLARSTRDAIERSRAGMSTLQTELQSGAQASSDDAPTNAPAATLEALTSRLEQLAGDMGGLAQAARDTRLAGGAHVARVQDLIAASHSLGRSAAKAASALQDLRLDATVTAESAPAAAPVRTVPVATTA
ncbi:MAG: methyl-accepting chemotaxis protein [Gemmatimonadaceae bacterium]